MNILIICYIFPPEHAPAGVMVSELAEDLSKNGHKITVMTGWPNHPKGVLFSGWKVKWKFKEFNSKGYKVIRCKHYIGECKKLYSRILYYLSFAISTLIYGCYEGSFDIIICVSTPIFGSWSAWLLSKIKHAKFIYEIFDIFPENAQNIGLIKNGYIYRILKKADSIMCKLSDVIITLSKKLKEEIVGRNISREKIYVIPFWLDGEKIKPSLNDNKWRRDQKIAPETFIALYAGTIGYISGAEILVETAQCLSKRKDILILCVGDGPVKSKIENESKKRNIENIRYLPFQPSELLNNVQASSNVGLITLLPQAGKTSIPSKILGYLAAARPVIASVDTNCDTAILINNAKCGKVTEVQNAKVLANAIEELADNVELSKKYGENGRKYFELNFAREKCTNKYLDVINMLMKIRRYQ